MSVTLNLSNEQLFQLLDELPQAKAQQVAEYLRSRVKENTSSMGDSTSKVIREPGSLKGVFLNMAEDFDEPLDDFKEYM